MTNRDRRRYDMLLRVRNFGASYAPRFPDTSPANAALATVTAEVDTLNALAVTEFTSSRSASAEGKRTARNALIGCLRRAGKATRVLAKTFAQIDARVELPEWADDLSLLTIARQFAAEAAPHAELLAAYGLELDELHTHIVALERALHERDIGRNEHVEARARIRASFSRALHAIELLDVIVPSQLRRDPPTLAVWKCARRVDYGDGPRNRADNESERAPAPDPISLVRFRQSGYHRRMEDEVAQNPAKHQQDNPTPDRQADRQRSDRGPRAEDRDAEPQGSGRTEGRDVPPADADRGLESPWMGGG